MSAHPARAHRRARREFVAHRGGTLLAVLLTLVVLSAMGAALAQRALTHVEAARVVARTDVARAAADAALVAAWQGWDGARHALDSVGSVSTAIAPGDSAVVELRVVHPDARLWWITATAWTPGGASARFVSRASALAVWSRLDVPAPQAAVSGAGRVLLAPGATIVANGAPPSGWSCPATVGFDALVLASPGTVSASAGGIVGPVRGPPAPSPDLAALWLAEAPVLAVLADVRLSVDTVLRVLPGASDSTCATAGWGEPDRADPTAPCQRRFALVHAQAGLTLGGRAQGVLLIDGPLVLDDSAQFAGVVVARGNVRFRTGARLSGALVMAGGTLTLDNSVRLEGAACVISAAIRGGMLLTEVPAQAWYTLR